MKKKIAVLCKNDDREVIEIIDYFYRKNMPVDLLLIETGKPEYKTVKKVISWELIAKRNKGNILHKCIAKVLKTFGINYSKKNFHLWKIFKTLSMKKISEKAGFTIAEVERHSSYESKKILDDHEISYVLYKSSNYLIKEPLLTMENRKIINAHCAKLPEHRGLDSLPWSVYCGDITGITTHYINKDIDAGDILLFKEIKPDFNDDLISFRMKIDSFVPEIMYETVHGLINNTIQPVSQNANDGTLHRHMTAMEFKQAEERFKQYK